MLVLEHADDARDLLRLPRLLGQQLRDLVGLALEGGQRELQVTGIGDGLQQPQRGQGVVRRCDVMRHLRGEPAGGAATAIELQLDAQARRTRHGHALAPRAVARQQLAVVAMGDDAQRPRMRHGHRRRVQRDGAADVETLHQIRDGLRKRVPPQIRLRAGQQQKRLAGIVADHLQRQLQLGAVGDGIAHHGHRRAARPVVDEFVVVEIDQRAVVQRIDEVAGRTGDRQPRVGISLQRDDHGQTAVLRPHIRGGELHLVHLVSLVHGLRLLLTIR